MAKTYALRSMQECRSLAEKTLFDFYQGKGRTGGFSIPLAVTTNMSFLGRFFEVDEETLRGINNPSSRYYTRSVSQSKILNSDKEIIFSSYEFNNKLLKIDVGIQFGREARTKNNLDTDTSDKIQWNSIASYEIKDRALVGRRKEIKAQELNIFNSVSPAELLTDLEKVSSKLLKQLKIDLDYLNTTVQHDTNFHFISGNNNEHIGILGEETPLQYIEKDSTVDLKV